MRAYLLDTNAASALWDELDPAHKDAMDFVRGVGGSGVIWAPRVIIAEIEYGFKVYIGVDPTRRAVIERIMYGFQVREIGPHTTGPYSDIRAALFLKFGDRHITTGKIKNKRPETLVDRTTSRELGIQENDLWIAAVAVEYNLILVTEDKLTNITLAYPDLKCIGWKKSSSPP